MSTTIAATDFQTPVHPGEILTEDFLKPLGLSVQQAAEHMNMPRDRLAKIASRKRAVTPDTALRLSRLFGTTAQVWLNLQAAYDLAVAEAEPRADIARIERFRAAG